mgnify:FL=1
MEKEHEKKKRELYVLTQDVNLLGFFSSAEDAIKYAEDIALKGLTKVLVFEYIRTVEGVIFPDIVINGEAITTVVAFIEAETRNM